MSDICKSDTACPMELISVYDNPKVSYDLYQCTKCGMLVKYGRWKDESRLFILSDNTVIKE